MKLSFQDYISIKIHKTDLVLSGYVKAKLEPYNLAPEQNLIMMLLWEQDGLTQYQLGEKLDKDKTNIARMAANLEKKGFVERRHCPEDRRSMRLYLTSLGQELGGKIIPITEEFNDIVCKGISKEELLQVERLLLKMKTNIENST
ncbi:MarR family transcriptional regulator [Mesobacillus maritimus]|uniref:MarR family winged helix-turn-helix transcriptional regulator n=1 Tax=Mesobacillus maritimus TaxID=1643336 RepID=UPI00203B28FE|nr:MarR family transcriptional regulator [Mesobacillus maritimus]MCM3586742.1 MarR family transcriptional regulator [Mesobacillus maritimus]MCM3668503.1 MarR family transcriptional regulator [Mesobacillus maritimus]